MTVNEVKTTIQLEMPEPIAFSTNKNELAFCEDAQNEVPGRTFSKREFSIANPDSTNSSQPKYRVLGQPGNFNSVVW